jgi:HK97 gp10 family phage protein
VKINIEVLGLKHLEDVLLRQIPAEARQGVMVGALKEAAKPIVAAAKQGYSALDGSGSLAIATSTWRSRRAERHGNHFASVEVGPRRSNRKALAAYYVYYGRKLTPRALNNGIRHAHLVEWGTARGMRAHRVMTRAFDSQAPAAVKSFTSILGKRIERATARMGRRQPKGAK